MKKAELEAQLTALKAELDALKAATAVKPATATVPLDKPIREVGTDISGTCEAHSKPYRIEVLGTCGDGQHQHPSCKAENRTCGGPIRRFNDGLGKAGCFICPRVKVKLANRGGKPRAVKRGKRGK